MNSEVMLEPVPSGTYRTKHGDGLISYTAVTGQLSISKLQGSMKIFVGTLPDGWVLMRPAENQPDWAKAEAHLAEMEEGYRELGITGSYGLAFVIMPLRKRYDDGVRTKDLYDAIMELE